MKDAERQRLLEHIAANVRRARRAQGLTQAVLAERIGVDTRTVQNVESAVVDVTATTLVAIAREVGVNVGVLVRPARFTKAKRGRPAKP
jgi:transcriptional regulator with XRE-family HTH domain